VPLGPGEVLTREDVRLGTDVCGRLQSRTRGFEHHSFRPFMVRTDPEIDPLIQGNLRTWRMSGSWKAKSPIMRFYHDLAASRLSYGMAKRATIQVWDSLEKIKASRDSKEFAKIRRSAKNRQRSATALQSKACRNSSLSSIPTRQRGRQPGRLLGVCATTGSFPSCCGATFRALERR